MADLNELTDRVLRFLSAIEDNQFDESRDLPLVVDGIAAAHDAIMPWVSKKAQATITSGVESFDLSTLDNEVYEIEAIFDPTVGEVLPSLLFEPGEVLHSRYWFPFPEGSITFNEKTSAEFSLYYLTYWDKPSEESDLEGELDPPDMCLSGLAYFATAYVLMPDMVQSAEIRQFNVRADSGHPEHNPIEKMVQFLLSMFNQEMDSLPVYQRGRN